MKKYEEETGKKAIWRDKVTTSFKKWSKGEKIYEKDKERITFLVSEGTKSKWQEYMQLKNISTFSKLIRRAIDYYMESNLNNSSKQSISNLCLRLKEPLTTIKGYTHLLIENYKDKFEWDVLSKIKDVYDQSFLLEKIIEETLNFDKKEHVDILIVDDDKYTNKVLVDIFLMKDLSIKTASSGDEAIRMLNVISPKIILLDVILPGISGYEICKKIKKQERFKDILIYYITAVPRNKVEEMIDETGADGYFLKPFNYSEFEILEANLSNS